MRVRGIRGAISVESNTEESIISAVKELLEKIVELNSFEIEDICSVFFSTTQDLDAAFPAVAAREMGWHYIPMICLNEMVVPKSSERILRVLMHVNTDKNLEEIKHVYLGRAVLLRPDLVEQNDFNI